jgi:hypothetical protein
MGYGAWGMGHPFSARRYANGFAQGKWGLGIGKQELKNWSFNLIDEALISMNKVLKFIDKPPIFVSNAPCPI